MADNKGILGLFEGADVQNLSEDFRTKAQTIFESAVSAKVSMIREELTKEFEGKMQEQADAALVNMETKIHEYISYIAEEWMAENKLAVDSGIKTELAESFLSGMKDLFTEHYVEIPEDKVDVVTEMAGTVDQLEVDRNKAINENIALKKQLVSLQKEKIVRDLSENLADTESDKLKALVAEITFIDEESFKAKVCTIAETFLGKSLCEEGCGKDGDDDDDDDDKKDEKKGKNPFPPKKDDEGGEKEEVDESVKHIAGLFSKKGLY